MKGIFVCSRLSCAIPTLIVALLIPISLLHGEPSSNTLFWKGGIDNNWATSNGGTNWTTDAGGANASLTTPSAISCVIFSGTGASNRSTVLGADTEMQSLTISDPAPVTIAGANTLTISGTYFRFYYNTSDNLIRSSGITLRSGAGSTTIACNLTLSGSLQVMDVNTNSGGLAVTGTIGGNATLYKTGGGLMTVAGNICSGTTIVSGGALRAEAANVISPQTRLSVNSGATFDLNNFDQSIGSLGGFTPSGWIAIDPNAPPPCDNGGTVILGTATLTVGSDNSYRDFNGVISGSGGVTKVGTGVWTLTGSNTYSGTTTIANGTIASTSDNALPNQSAVVIGSTGSLVLRSWYSYGYGSWWIGYSPTIGSLAGSGSVILGPSTLTIGNNNTSTTFSGVISDSSGDGAEGGSINKIGTGTLILSGTNTYTGTTTVTAGTLRAGAEYVIPAASALVVDKNGAFDLNGFDQKVNSLAGSGSVILGPATLTIGNNNTSTIFSGVISGSSGGAITKVGTGTLTLGGTNTYTGTTTVTTGTLRAGAEYVIPAASALVVDQSGIFDLNGFDQKVNSLAGSGSVILGPATLTIGNNNTSMTFSGVISDSSGDDASGGSITKVGTGVLTLGGANTYTGTTTVTAGTLRAGAEYVIPAASTLVVDKNGTFDLGGFNQRVKTLADGPNGSGIIELGGATLFVTNGGENFSGIITGSGGLTKEGSDILTLSGENNYTASTTVSGGGLVVNGSIRGDVLVSKGFLGGSGRVGGNVENQSLVSPGNSPGTLTVGGNYNQSATGTLLIQLASLTNYDRLVIGGQASLNGGLSVEYLDGFKPAKNDIFVVLTAGNGVSGQFASFTSPLQTNTLLNFGVVYYSNLVVLKWIQGSFANDVPGLTTNERAVATALDKVVDSSRVAGLVDQLDTLPIGSIPSALEKIVPTQLLAMFDASIAASTVQADNLERRLEEVRNGSLVSTSGLHLTDSRGTVSGQGDGKQAIGKDGKELEPAPLSDRWGYFINGSGEFVDTESTAAALGTDFTTGGISAGADYRFGEHAVAGVTAGYANTKTGARNDDSVKINSGKLGLYGTVFSNGFFLNGGVAGGLNSYDTKRDTVGGNATGDTEGTEFNTLLGTGYTYKTGGWSFGPVASLRYSWVGIDGFTERGSLAPLRYDDQSEDSLRSTAGAQLSYAIQAGKIVVTPSVRAQWQHEYLDSSRGIGASFLPGGSFSVSGPEVGRDSLLLDAGVTVQLTARVGVYAAYTGELFRDNYSDQSVNGGVQVQF